MEFFSSINKKIEVIKLNKKKLPDLTDEHKLSILANLNKKKNKDALLSLLDSKEPLVLDDFEGIIWMRSSCGNKPCKGHYQ
ncbi:MAG: hypothetical protein V1914_02575 [archaeon]